MASNRCRLKWAHHFIYALTGDEFQMAVVLRSLGPSRVVAGKGVGNAGELFVAHTAVIARHSRPKDGIASARP
jgi:hypothetical protein